MCSPRGSTRRRLCAALGLTLLAVAPAGSAAQDVETARHKVMELEARVRIADARADSIRRARTAELNDSMHVEGRLIRFNTRALLPGDRARLGAALADARRSLEARFGATGAALSDAIAWELRSPTIRIGEAPLQLRAPTLEGGVIGVTYFPPLPADEVAGLSLRVAGITVAHRHPALAAFVPTLSLEESSDPFTRAARNLVLNSASVGGRCVAGALAACRTALSPLRDGSPLEAYYTSADHRALVAASASARNRRDSASVARRDACLDGEGAACTALARTLNVRYPFREHVRGTFARHALERGGTQAIARLDSARGRFADDPIGLLVYVSGESEAQLLSGWRARLSAAAAEDAAPPLAPVLLSSIFWSAILGLVVARRRPR